MISNGHQKMAAKPMVNFNDISYLKQGNSKQQQVYSLLSRYRIFDQLVLFNPFLAGTIPINIDIDDSDVDIICSFVSPTDFEACLIENFQGENGFSIKRAMIDQVETVIGNFRMEGFDIEIFGQPIPVEQQNAYRHMLIEHRILQLKGEAFIEAVRALKKDGYRTEPAFAKLLKLKGNPYTALLHYKI